MPQRVVIASAVRTPFTRAHKGELKDTRPDTMAGWVIKAAVDQVPGLKSEDIEDVVLGCAMPEAEQGNNVARIAAAAAGLPDTVPGMTINRFCSSGVQSIALAAQAIQAGSIDVAVAGGTESMTMIPMGGNKFSANPELMKNYPEIYTTMGATAEIVAQRFEVSREDQDAFAAESQRRAEAAQDNGNLDDEIIEVTTQVVTAGGVKEVTLKKDTINRRGTSCGGGGGGGGTDFSYIWIANSNEGTISKVNTQTLVEEGRYLVRPDGGGSPSRTSVNLNGDVVVASRQGGATMFAARPEDCPDPLNTSTGPGDVKPWPDGCMVWHTPFATDSQRPVAWSQGQFNDATCRYENMKVWTSTHNSNTTIATIYRLNGETGAIEDQVDATNVQTHVFGLYGAAVDADGNMWASELSVGQLVNVDLETMAIRQWNMPTSGYGMTVDSDGFVWTCSSTVARFDPTTETWQTSAGLSSSGNGCMEDGNGTLWVAADGFVGIDTATLMETQVIPLPARVRGVSFDFEGNIWGPSINSNEAYRVNPVTLVTDTVTGFNYPYTYSDMTGFALSNAGTPSG